MSETIQMRTTQEQSGDYQVYAAATIGGEQTVKGLAIHDDISGQIEADYIAVTFDGDGAVSLSPDKATSATVRFATDSVAVRHAYVEPSFLEGFGNFTFDGDDTDLEAVPAFGISAIEPSSEEAYEQDKEEQSTAEDAADALLGGSDDDSEEEAEADDSDEEEAEEVGVDDETLGIVDN
jgi:hypothetical protein